MSPYAAVSEEEPFFVTRNGAVWACWLSGKPAVKLGAEPEVRTAMEQYLAQSAPAETAKAAFRKTLTTASSPPHSPPLPPPASNPRLETGNERREKRHDLTITGRVFSRLGPRTVTILDLSEKGCRFYDGSARYEGITSLTIKLGPIGPIEATVKWSDKGYAGIEFDTPLYPSVLDHIRQHFDLRS